MNRADIERLQDEYDALCRDLEPQISRLASEGDRHAADMRRLFGAASEAWEGYDRATAKLLSEQGHSAKARSERVNAEANELRERLSVALGRLTAARDSMSSRHKAAAQPTILHGTK